MEIIKARFIRTLDILIIELRRFLIDKEGIFTFSAPDPAYMWFRKFDSLALGQKFCSFFLVINMNWDCDRIV